MDSTPGLLACFSIDGCSTLIWNRIVRMQYPHLLTRPGFIMAQLTLNKPIPRRHLTPEFAPAPADNEVNILTKP